MNHTIKHKSLIDIPKLPYEGYVWMSDAKEPIVLNKETFDFSKIGINPFIIEALLYCDGEDISIHIQHTGEYQIFEYHLNDFSKKNLVEKDYLPHRLNGVKNLIFKQIWMPEPDENCAGIDVMNLKVIVFCGFKK
ncbi:MAG: type III CRISPR-associated protein [Bacteroidetes bacterium CG2_30_33_31]|nr:MAG: type III CRISPR-associated protein [Bacteroidetes bacterium CG2_30_33_31]